MTKDEALRVAREALEPFANFGTREIWVGTMWADKTEDAQVLYSHAIGEAITLGDFFRAVSALRTIALAVGAPSDGVEVDRDSDGELLIDWFPSPGRMLTMSLRHDGRLSYAFRWDGEQAHGTAQMPPAVQSVALGEPKAIQHPSTRPRSVDDPSGLPGTSNGQENGNGR